MFSEQVEIEQIDHAQSAATGFVFIGRTDAARGRADFHAAGGVFGSELDHAVIRQDHVRAIADEKIAVDLDSRLAQCRDFFKKRNRIEHYAVADHAAAALTQHSAWHELKNEALAINNDGMASVVTSGIARHHGELFREYIDDLALTLISPLGSDYDRSLTRFQLIPS